MNPYFWLYSYFKRKDLYFTTECKECLGVVEMVWVHITACGVFLRRICSASFIKQKLIYYQDAIGTANSCTSSTVNLVAGLHFGDPETWTVMGVTLQPTTIGQHPARSKGPCCPCKDLDTQMVDNGVVGGSLENGPYIVSLPTSNKVCVTAVLFFIGVVPWQVTTFFFN